MKSTILEFCHEYADLLRTDISVAGNTGKLKEKISEFLAEAVGQEPPLQLTCDSAIWPILNGMIHLLAGKEKYDQATTLLWEHYGVHDHEAHQVLHECVFVYIAEFFIEQNKDVNSDLSEDELLLLRKMSRDVQSALALRLPSLSCETSEEVA